MVKTTVPPPPAGPIQNPNAPEANPGAYIAQADARAAEAARCDERGAADPNPDAFESAAPLNPKGYAASLANALAANLSAANAANTLGNAVSDAASGGLRNQKGTTEASFSLSLLQSLAMPQRDALLEGALGQLVQLAQFFGQLLQADILTWLASLDGQPASLLQGDTDGATLWRALALSNRPLSTFTLIATGSDIAEDSGLLPNTAYRVLGTFVDANHEPQVRLGLSALGGAPNDEEAMQAQATAVPFSLLQRAMLLALIGDPRIDIPYAHELDAANGPGQANCCMFAHSTGAARSAATVSQHAPSMGEPRCRSCVYARASCLPET